MGVAALDRNALGNTRTFSLLCIQLRCSKGDIKIKIAYTFYWKEQTQRLLSVVIRPEMKIWDQCLRYKGSILPKHDNPNKKPFFHFAGWFKFSLRHTITTCYQISGLRVLIPYGRFKTLVSVHRKAKTSARLPCEGEHGGPHTWDASVLFVRATARRCGFSNSCPLENKMVDPIEDYLNRLDFNQLYPIYIETHRSECL